jgi:cyclopropane fatty-acyl-phospholipid synthase-like methyltransferase
LSNIVASFFAQAKMDDGAILDVGCGAGTFGIVLTAVRRTNKPFLVGYDVYEPYLRMLPPNIYDGVVQASGTHLPFRDRCFNNVVSIAVIEHLEKESGVQMLREMERVAKRLTVIMTSRGFIPKNADDNPYQMHRSGWNSKDFKSRGIRCVFFQILVTRSGFFFHSSLLTFLELMQSYSWPLSIRPMGSLVLLI